MLYQTHSTGICKHNWRNHEGFPKLLNTSMAFLTMFGRRVYNEVALYWTWKEGCLCWASEPNAQVWMNDGNP